MAFRKDVVMERKVLPYDTRFDSLHWWATCRLQQILLQHFYKDGLLQFNFVRISNLEHDRYTFENNDEGVYQDEVLSWLNLSLNSPVKDICKQPSKLALLFGTLRNLAKLGLLWRPGVFGSLAQTWRKSWTLSKSIETKQLPNLLKEGNEWVIYGYGEVGQKLMQSLVQEEKGSAIKKVVDRQAKKSPFEVDGVSVESPDSIEYSSNVRVIVASFSFVKQIEFYLKYGLGLDSHQILLLRES
ncbi:MAG: hypothetical protein GJ680_20070 [Alteromonadaceae bacterium]|nr:hypothetical protein [Alteromonadaceae bacterium]